MYLWEESKAARSAAIVAAVLVAAIGLASWVASVASVQVSWSQWVQMGPTTAGSLLIMAGLLLILARRNALHRWWLRAGLTLGGALAVAHCVDLTGRLAGVPLLSADSLAGPRLWRTAAFAVLSVAFALAFGAQRVAQIRSEGVVSEGDEPRMFRRRGRWQIALALTGLSLALTWSGYAYLARQLAQAKRALHDSLTAVCMLKESQVEAWRAERLGDAHTLALAPFFVKVIETLSAGTATSRTQEALTRYFLEYRKAYGYEDVILLDRNFAPLFASPASAGALEGWEQKDLANIALAGDVAVKDLHREPRGGLCIEFLAPVRSSDGSFAGAVLLRVDPRRDLLPMIQRWPETSASAELMLVRRDGDSVTILSELRFRPGAPLDLRLPIFHSNLPAAAAVAGHGTELGEGVDYRGVPVVFVSRAVDRTPWFLIAKMDRAEAYETVRSEARKLSAFVLLGFVVVALLVAGYWRARQRTYEQLHEETERQRRAAVERLAVVMRNANDAILLFDSEMRIVDANDRALALYGRDPLEMRRLTIYDLRGDERKGQGEHSSIADYPSEGAVFETNHRRRDGAVFPVEVSARPVEIDGSKYLLAITRDVTERKAQDLEIERLTRMFFVISHVNQVLVRAKSREELFASVCRVLVDDGRFTMAWIGVVDPKTRWVEPVAVAGDTYGYVARIRISTDADVPEGQGPSGTAFREGRSHVCNDFFSDPHTAPWREQAAKAGFHSSIAVPLQCQGEKVGLLTVYAAEVGFFRPRKVALLEETAGDISFALDAFEAEARKRRADDALKASEGRMQFLLTAAPVVVYSVQPSGDFRTTFISQNVRAVLGHQAKSFVEDPSFWHAHVHPEDIAAADGAARELKAGGIIRREYRFRHADGSWRWMRDETTLVCNSQGEPLELVGSWFDITERKRSEEELRAREEIFSIIVAQAMDSIALVEIGTGRIVEFNRSAHEGLGYTREEFASLKVEDFQNDHDTGQIRRHIESAIETGGISFESRHKTRDGSPRDVRVSIRPLRLRGIDYISAVWSDITEIKQAESQLRILSSALDQSPSSVVITDLSGAIEYVNPYFTEVTGYALEEVLGKNPRLLKSGLTPPETFREMWDTLAKGKPWRGELINQTKSGAHFTEYAVVTPITDAQGKPTHYAALKVDITDRKRTEAALRRSEELYRLMAENSADIIWLGDLKTRCFTYMSPAVRRVRGFSPEELVGRPIADSLPPEVRESVLKDVLERVAAFEAGDEAARTQTYELELLTKDGAMLPAEVVITLMQNPEGRVMQVLGITRDISQRRRAEAQLRKLSRTVDQAPLSIVITNLSGAIEYVNPAFLATTGYSREEVQGQNPRVLKSGATPQATYVEMWQTLARGEVWSGELCNKKKNGDLYFECAIIAPVVDESGTPTHYVAIKEDVTERKRTESALAEVQERYQLIANNTADVIWLYDLSSERFTYCSPSVVTLLGRSPSEMLGLRMVDLLTPQSAEVALESLSVRLGRLAGGDPSARTSIDQVDQVRSDGASVPTEVVSTLLADSSGKMTQVLGISRDITERRRSEEALRESRDRLTDAEHIARLGNWVLDLKTGEVIWSDGMFRLLGLDPATAHPSAEGFTDLMPPEDRNRLSGLLEGALASGKGFVLGHRLVFPGGQTRYVEGSCQVVRSQSGEPVRAVGTVQDVTERKLAEIELNELVKQLRELHRISQAFERRDLSADQLLEIVASSLPGAMGSPSDAHVIVEIDGARITCGPALPLLAQISAPIVINERSAGYLTVGYVRLQESSPGEPFSVREREVVHNVARSIGVGVGEREAFAAVRRFSAELEQKVAERTAELAAGNRQIRALLDSIPDLVMRIGQNGTLISFQEAKGGTPLANSSFAAEFGPNPQMGSVLRSTVLASGAQALAEGRTVSAEASLASDTGQLAVEVRTSPIGAEEFVVFVRDITARKRLETEAAGMLEKERQVSEMKSRFISVTSHEFRTPMAAAMGSVELLRNHLDRMTQSKREELFTRINLSMRRMTDMLDEILTLSRIDAGRIKAQVLPIDLRQYTRGGHRRDPDGGPRRAPVCVYERGFGVGLPHRHEHPAPHPLQPPQQRSPLFAHWVHRHDEACGRCARGGDLRGGPGHRHPRGGSEPNLRTVRAGFERWHHQGHRARPEHRQAHGGTARRNGRSQLGPGSRQPLHRASSPGSRGHPMITLSTPTVLVIEDDEPVRRTLVDILDMNGYRAVSAPTGTEGLTLARSELPSLIITDIEMPGLNGFELLQQFRSDEGLRGTPVIVITAKVDRAAARRGMELGADDFITKPFTEDEVIRSVRTRLEKKELMDELDAFAHTVAHDLKNPLATLNGRLGLLELTLGKADEALMRKNVREASLAAARLGSIIDDLLVLAGVRRQPITSRELDMGKVVGEALERLEELIKKTEANVHSQPNWPVALGHAPWVAHVWANYISNAAKYAGPKAEITLGAELRPDVRRVRFWVQDRGPGLGAAAQAALFVPFTRISTVRAGGSHGLGLSIVRRIVEKLDGQVGVESRPGQGARFWFELPSGPGPASQP